MSNFITVTVYVHELERDFEVSGFITEAYPDTQDTPGESPDFILDTIQIGDEDITAMADFIQITKEVRGRQITQKLRDILTEKILDSEASIY